MDRPEQTLDWRSIAARVAMADGHFRLLTTFERDQLETAIETERTVERPADWQVQDALRQFEGLRVMREAYTEVFGETPPGMTGLLLDNQGKGSPGLSGPGSKKKPSPRPAGDGPLGDNA